MKAILESEGYVVDCAVTGKEAIKKTQETTYNLALIDIRLPDMEGVELLKLMKDAVPRTRKIIITSYPTMQNAVLALNSNADAYLVKPLNMEKLLEAIKDQLQLQADEREYGDMKVAEFIESRVKELNAVL
jgi:DNA-binding response OmpR family regulator